MVKSKFICEIQYFNSFLFTNTDLSTKQRKLMWIKKLLFSFFGMGTLWDRRQSCGNSITNSFHPDNEWKSTWFLYLFMKITFQFKVIMISWCIHSLCLKWLKALQCHLVDHLNLKVDKMFSRFSRMFTLT